jgi:hypothetical protein
MALGKEEIEHRFGFHKATIEGANATLPMHRDVRIAFREFAEKLDELLPEGRAKSVAFTHLEDASMWTHKSIAELSPLVEEPIEEPVENNTLRRYVGKSRGEYVYFLRAANGRVFYKDSFEPPHEFEVDEDLFFRHYDPAND